MLFSDSDHVLQCDIALLTDNCTYGETLGNEIWTRLLGEGGKQRFFFGTLRDPSVSDADFNNVMKTLYLMLMRTTIHLHTKVRNVSWTSGYIFNVSLSFATF